MFPSVLRRLFTPVSVGRSSERGIRNKTGIIWAQPGGREAKSSGRFDETLLTYSDSNGERPFCGRGLFAQAGPGAAADGAVELFIPSEF